jgi:hypothetical protein
LFANCHIILARWRKYISQMLNVHVFIYVRQTEIYITDSLVTEPSASEIEMATDEIKVTHHQALIKYKQN